MPIIRTPVVVGNAMGEFIGKFFTNQPQRDHVANYLTGLMICPNKTVAGMTSEQPNASDQSCLNRFLTEVDWVAQKLNEERIKWLQNFDGMKFHERGIIALDDVLLDSIVALVAPTGKSIKDSGTFWDHSEKRYVHAQDLIIINSCHQRNKSASVKLTTIGESCRAMLRESVSAMIGWVIEQLESKVKVGRNTCATSSPDSALHPFSDSTCFNTFNMALIPCF